MPEPKPDPATKPTTFDENLADVGADDARERENLERAQKALQERRTARWKKQGQTK